MIGYVVYKREKMFKILKNSIPHCTTVTLIPIIMKS